MRAALDEALVPLLPDPVLRADVIRELIVTIDRVQPEKRAGDCVECGEIIERDDLITWRTRFIPAGPIHRECR